MNNQPILFAYDGSLHADAALDIASQVLEPGPALVACVWLPTVVLLARAFVFSYVTDLGALDATEEEKATAIAVRGAERAGALGFPAQAVTLRAGGPIWREIVDLGRDRDARAIVVGSRGRHGASEVLLGSVSARVADHADRPVLVGHTAQLAAVASQPTADGMRVTSHLT